MNGRILLAMMAILAAGQVRADLLPAGREIDSSVAGRPAGILLIPRAAATPTLRASQPASTRTGINPVVSQPAGEACRRAVAAAERAHGIPVHLLAAIARVESGRRDQSSGTFDPWPWTINFDGQGSFYDNKMQAVAAATLMRPQVTKSIDIGCLQISLTNHPSAFPTMEQAFDPFANADYGARFLVQLFEKTGSWPKAVEWYHSATPELGHDYGLKVYAALPEETRQATIADPSPLAAAWGATLGHSSSAISPFGQSPPHMLPRVTGLGGEPAPGRTLDSYRTNPVRLSFRLR
jgi:hypothetical protein